MAEIFHSRFSSGLDGFSSGTRVTTVGSADPSDVDGALEVGAGVTSVRDFENVTSGVSRVDFWLRLDDTTTTTNTFNANTFVYLLANGATVSSANAIAVIGIDRDTINGATALDVPLVYRGASAFSAWENTPRLRRGAWWFKVAVVVYHESKTYDLYLQDRLWLTGKGWPNAGAAGLGRIAILGQAAAPPTRFDDIRVEANWALPAESTLVSDTFTSGTGALGTSVPVDTRNLHAQPWVVPSNSAYGGFTRSSSGAVPAAGKRCIALARCGPDGEFVGRFRAGASGVYGGIVLRCWGGPATDAYYTLRYYSSGASKVVLFQSSTAIASAANPSGLTVAPGDDYELRVVARGRYMWCYMRNITAGGSWQLQFGAPVAIHTDATGARGLLCEDHAGIFIDTSLGGVGTDNAAISFAWSGRPDRNSTTKSIGQNTWQLESGAVKELYRLDSGQPTRNLFWSRGIQFSHRAENDMGEDGAAQQAVVYDAPDVAVYRQRGVLMSEDTLGGYGDSHVTILRRGIWVEDVATVWGVSVNFAPDNDLRSDLFAGNGYRVVGASGSSTLLSHSPEHDWRNDILSAALPLGFQVLATFGSGVGARVTHCALNNQGLSGAANNLTSKSTGDGAPISIATSREMANLTDGATYKLARAYYVESASALSDSVLVNWRDDLASAGTVSCSVGSLYTSAPGDYNGDGFNERHGWYEITGTGGGAVFTLPVSGGARCMPVFRIWSFVPTGAVGVQINGVPATAGTDYVIDTVAPGVHILQLLTTRTADTTIAVGVATVTPTGIASAGVVSSPVVTARRRVDVAGIPSAVAIGAPVVTAPNIGVIHTEPFKDWAGSVLSNALLENVMVIKVADRSVALSVGNRQTAGDGTLTLSSAALVPGTDYMVVAFDATGATRGIKAYEAA